MDVLRMVGLDAYMLLRYHVVCYKYVTQSSQSSTVPLLSALHFLSSPLLSLFSPRSHCSLNTLPPLSLTTLSSLRLIHLTLLTIFALPILSLSFPFLHYPLFASSISLFSLSLLSQSFPSLFPSSLLPSSFPSPPHPSHSFSHIAPIIFPLDLHCSYRSGAFSYSSPFM